MSTQEINQLENLVRSHDQDALAELLELYRPRLRAFVTKNMSSALAQKVDADDIVQETCLSCLTSLPEIEFSTRQPFDWVCHVAKRRIMDAGRRYSGSQKRDVKREVAQGGGNQPQSMVDLLVASITSPSKAFSRDQREFKLWSAFEQLPEESRSALQMRYVEALPTKQIAERMGKSDGAIRVMLTRSLKKLEAIIEAESA